MTEQLSIPSESSSFPATRWENYKTAVATGRSRDQEDKVSVQLNGQVEGHQTQ